MSNNKEIKHDTWLGVRELCQYLCIAKPTVYQLTSERRISFYKKTGKILFKRQEVDDWVTEGRMPAKKPAKINK